MASSTTSSSSKSEFLVNGKYRLIRKIGSGSFGDIYLGINVSNGEVADETCLQRDFVLGRQSCLKDERFNYVSRYVVK